MVAPYHHGVDFYEQETELGRRVATYLAEGLERGEAAVVIATPDHRALFADALAQRGVDVARCRNHGLLREEDAEELLSALLVGGVLDATRFDALVGGLLSSTTAVPGRRVVGEMVQLLWERGDVLGAASLEEEWNRLALDHDFELYCCYRAGGTAGDDEALACIRDLHTAVVSTPPATSWLVCRDARTFSPAVTSPRGARVFVADLLRRWGLEGQVEAASIIVSELSTNGVLHAATPFEVDLSQRGGVVRIAVHDASPAPPVVVEPAISEAGGRGLGIVAALACGWGVETEATGKTVWADLEIGSR